MLNARILNTLYDQVLRKDKSPVALNPVPETVALYSFAANKVGSDPAAGYLAPIRQSSEA